MSPADIDIVRRKLAVIIENLKALQPIRDLSTEQYIEDVYKRKAAERLLQELIKAAIDINMHILAQSGDVVPDDYYESFIMAGDLKIISSELATKLAPSAGLRNRLVHEYDRLEHSLVLDAVSMSEELYAEYVKEIEDYISGTH
jgi:uncharacterized protein YutE (UPF0331/DUF86 family)